MSLIAIIEERFPTRIAYGYAGAPSWQTERVITGGGFVYKNKRWAVPLRKFTVDTENASLEEFAELDAFRLTVAEGAFGSFRLKDWADFQASNENCAPALGDGSNLIFQLARTYVYGSRSVVRPIYKPNTDVPIEIFVDGTAVSGSNWSLDYTTGILTFAGGHAPSNGVPVVWDGEFDIAAEFDADYQPATYENFFQINAKGIGMTEVRLA